VQVLEAPLAAVRSAGLRPIGTSSHHGTAHTDADLTGRVALVVGNEAHGLSDDAAVDEWVTIRHHGRAESLNVAMAATVLCFEAARQRHQR
jgi:TrmH family RNA methyltransferase